MVVIGLDPGLEKTGFGVIAKEKGVLVPLEYGCIFTDSSERPQDRLWTIFTSLEELVRKYRPSCFGVEKVFFHRNVSSAMNVSQARGVMLALAGKYNLEIGEYTPTQIKLAVTGYGRSDKQQVTFMVKSILRIKEELSPPDIFDALAAAICHLHYVSSPLAQLRQG